MRFFLDVPRVLVPTIQSYLGPTSVLPLDILMISIEFPHQHGGVLECKRVNDKLIYVKERTGAILPFYARTRDICAFLENCPASWKYSEIPVSVSYGIKQLGFYHCTLWSLFMTKSTNSNVLSTKAKASRSLRNLCSKLAISGTLLCLFWKAGHFEGLESRLWIQLHPKGNKIKKR